MRRFLLAFTISWLLPFIGFGTINWLIDPYRLFHQPWIREDYYLANLRIQAAGIINSNDFDSIILGTSMAENFSPSEASNVLKGNFLNLSLYGSTPGERAVVLEYALKRKKILKVIFSIDWGTLVEDAAKPAPIAAFAYLYDDLRWNDFWFNFSNPTLVSYWYCRNIIARYRYCENQRTLENLTAWHMIPYLNSTFGGLSKWLEAKGDSNARKTLTIIATAAKTVESGKVNPVAQEWASREILKYRRGFNADLLRFAARYPETQFYLFFPPYSRLHYAIAKQSEPTNFEIYLKTLRFVVDDCHRYANCKVFGFDTEPFLDDIANYRDLMHYHQRYNSEMLRWMGNENHELTPANLDAYIAAITEKAVSYPLKGVGAVIEKALNPPSRP